MSQERAAPEARERDVAPEARKREARKRNNLRKTRWRLVLGRDGTPQLGGCSGKAAAQDQALDFLYGRETEGDRNIRREDASRRDGSRGAGQETSRMTVPEWIAEVHRLFPRETVERLEKDALDRYQPKEMVTDPEVLRGCQPNMTLLKAVLTTKHLMNQEVLKEARRLVARVVRELLEKLARPIRSPFVGALDPRRRTRHKMARNFDPKETIRRNLAHWDAEEKRLYIERPYFFSRVRRHMDRWRMIILVDQSGSMLDSVIHASVTAGVFWGLALVDTHLVLFDTAIVDVTGACTDPVETLMKVQLGGGTDIGQALTYAGTLITDPRRTIVVVLSDFYEGAPESRLLAAARRLTESGVTLLGLAALDPDCRPDYDRDLAAAMVRLGAEVAAMTPGELAEWVAEKVR